MIPKPPTALPTRPFYWSWLGLFFLLPLGATAQVICDTNIALSLDPNCEGIVTPNTFLASDRADESPFLVSIDGIGTAPTITLNAVGTYSVSIIELATGNSCGPHTLVVNDELGPTLSCTTLRLDCDAAVPFDPPTALDACCWTDLNFAPPFELNNLSQIDDFDGPFAPDNWTFTFDGGQAMEDVRFNFAGTQLTLLGDSFGPANFGDPCNNPDPGNPLCYTATACIDVPISGSIRFDWTNEPATGSPGHAPDFDPTAYSIQAAGGSTNYTVLSTSTTTSGTVSNLALNAGDQFCLIIGSNGFNSFSEAVVDNFSFQPVAADPCNDNYLLRRWVATDCNGAMSSCIQAVVFDDLPTAGPADLLGVDALDCEAGFAVDANGNPDPTVTGLPTGCNISFTYDDLVINSAGCQGASNVGCYKVLRRWVILDECTFDKILDTQQIQVVDQIGPIISGVGDVTISTPVDDCVASYFVPEPTLSDNCSDLDGYTVQASAGTVSFLSSIQRFVLTDLPLGDVTLTYRAEDCCGNVTDAVVNIRVEDQVPPNVSCEVFRNTTLTVNGTSRILAPAFDDGSNDACSPTLWFKVLREDNSDCADLNGDDDPGGANDIWFDDEVFFCCADLGNPVMVTLRVFDVDPGTGPVDPSRMQSGGDLFGRFNECTVSVNVLESLAPLLTCPPDLTVSCEFWFDPANLSAVFGDVVTDESLRQDIVLNDPGNTDLAQPFDWGRDGLAFDNCGILDISRDATFDLSCGTGIIVRTFTATDLGGRTASCVQRISIVDFDPYFINDTDASNSDPTDGVIWPADFNSTLSGGSCASDTNPAVTGSPTILNNDACALISVTSSDTEISPDPNSCRKIRRTWVVTDLCNYPPPFPNPSGNPGQWRFDQLITIVDTDAPIFEACADTIIAVRSFNANCEASVSLRQTASDNCVNAADLVYSYAIDLNNTSSSGNIFEFSGSDSMFTENLPLGSHLVVWKAEDRCGNIGQCVQIVTVADSLPPNALALDGIALDINPATNSVDLMAMMVDGGSTDLCGSIAQRLLNYPSLGAGQSTPPPGSTATLTFDCNNTAGPYPDTVAVDFWVQDQSGTWDYVTTSIVVQDNNFACTPSPNARVSGLVERENGASLSDVKVAVGDAQFSFTDSDGAYTLNDLETFEDYRVTPRLNTDFRDGVSTLDLLEISRHLIGLELLDSPYKRIAADVNKDGRINTLDLVDIQKLLLYFRDDFPNNTSWRFVDATHTFLDPEDPFRSPFPEVYQIPSLQQDMADVNFIALKVGDVNGSAQNNAGALANDRREPWLLSAVDRELVAGREYELLIRAEEGKTLQGFQWELAFDPTQLAYLGYEATGEGNHVESLVNDGLSGRWLVSWAAAGSAKVVDGPLFRLRFQARVGTSWSKALGLSEQSLRAEAYHRATPVEAVQILQPRLVFEPASEFADRAFSLFPNRPNPFQEETTLSFYLPEDSPLILRIFDPTGRLVQQFRGQFAAGYHERTIYRTDLDNEGLFIVRLETPQHTATQKMILSR
ncbi:MAG: T9SS type A sorting domain-containing protein [Bacteroidota bacterium]